MDGENSDDSQESSVDVTVGSASATEGDKGLDEIGDAADAKDPSEEWDRWFWGDPPELEDENGTEFDDLIERISREGEKTEDRIFEEYDSGESDVTAGPDTIGTQSDGTNSDRMEGVGFDDLLQRVEQREQRIDREQRPGTDLRSICRTSDATSVLLIGSRRSDIVDETCLSAFDLEDSSHQRVLLISLMRRKPSRLDLFLDRYDIADTAEIAHLSRRPTDNARDTRVRSTQVNDPGDLATLGITISKILDDWKPSQGQITICLHSLTALTQTVTNERAFRFFHLLLGRIEEVDAHMHVHADPSENEGEDLELYRDLFDITVEVDEDGLHVAR